MKKSMLEIYALAVCFATMVIMVISILAACYDIVQVIHPESTMSPYAYSVHQSNDAFWRHACYYSAYYNVKKDKRPPEEELTKKRLESYKGGLKDESRSGGQKLAQALFFIIAALIFFLIHWRIARRAREANNAVGLTKKSAREIYALAVCFITMIIIVIVLATSCYNILEKIWPEFTMRPYTYLSHQSNDEFWSYVNYSNAYYNASNDKRPIEQELTQKRLESYKFALLDERRFGTQRLIKHLIFLALVLIFFIIHWGIARRVRETYNTADAA